MFRGVPLLMRVGVIMMALALALVAAAAVVSAALRSEPERLVPAEEVAAKSTGEAPRTSSGEEVSATKKSSSEKESSHHPSAKEQVGQRKEKAREPQAVFQQQEAERPDTRSAKPRPAGRQTPSGASPGQASQPPEHRPIQQDQPLPGSERRNWPKPTRGELESANRERRYELLPGAIMGLTIKAMGIYDAPVFDSDGRWALANGVAHNPQTSLPWSQGAQRNVYLAGHRMGFRGTWSRMIFYNLHKLGKGDEILLKDRAGTSYRYRVSEVFVVD
ncbi:MAG TPA: sortase, partial [Rubrobacter sp.]|nr:sortase [Rubrobacter sp.]